MIRSRFRSRGLIVSGVVITAIANGDGTIFISVPANKITRYSFTAAGDGTTAISVPKGQI